MSKMVEDLIRTGYIITIEEVWTKDHNKGFWIAKDTGGRVCHAQTAEKAVAGVRKMFWKDLKKSCLT